MTQSVIDVMVLYTNKHQDECDVLHIHIYILRRGETVACRSCPFEIYETSPRQNPNKSVDNSHLLLFSL